MCLMSAFLQSGRFGVTEIAEIRVRYRPLAVVQQTVNEYVDYYNRWRPHRSLGQRASCPDFSNFPQGSGRTLAAKPVLGGLHHVYQWAA
jgi:transposase InsO family protein